MIPPPDLVVDGGDRLCVRLLIELRAHVAAARPGAVIHLIASDPAAPIDLPAWCHLTGNDYLGQVPGAARSTYALRVGGGARETEPKSPWRTRVD
ncbi:sulfurtransferase TusA family protein [Nonomuraea rhodomycinica]|uniref:Sulfurtransferase TusA family protein n=1 Tax=Nonomuraea rhodomycinica TaxID=1712872 RepID=A0A7Y6M9C0_9ACTN|nr:sulfurtransferase TusA family protein [Nonomuraea rhodomycinica]NUW39482.1 sulfurtransferase TusA family protein [Nonomuraea rhodomycinica]